MIWYVHLSTAIGLTPGGSSTVHIYTHTQYIEKHSKLIGKSGALTSLYKFMMCAAITLTLRLE